MKILFHGESTEIDSNTLFGKIHYVSSEYFLHIIQMLPLNTLQMKLSRILEKIIGYLDTQRYQRAKMTSLVEDS